MPSKYKLITLDNGTTAKECSYGHDIKTLDKFSPTKKGLGGRHSRCIDCHVVLNKLRYDGDKKGYYRKCQVKRYNGMTLEEYDEILEHQNNQCAICGKTSEEEGRRLSIDHNHETGEIRGLLCRMCNLVLGNANDDISILSNQ